MELGEEIIDDLAKIVVNSNLDEKMLTAINLGIAEGLCRNGDIEDGVALYERIAGGRQKLNNILSDVFIEKLRDLAQELFNNKKYTNALIQYKRLSDLIELSAKEYLNMANCLIELGQDKSALFFLQKYEELEPNKLECFGTIGEILGFKLKMYAQAISYLEKYIGLSQQNALAYNTLGHFYSTYYNYEYLEKQLDCFLKAHSLNPNNKTYVHNVIYVYEKMGDLQNAGAYYEKLLKLNPAHLDYYDYGCFLIRKGDLKDGYKYLEHRFFAPEVTREYPNWLDINKRLKSCDQAKDKTILLFHEGGYGDSIMYSRFIEGLSQYAKEILLFVPDNMISLFEDSKIDAQIHSMTDDLTQLDYDYNASLIDLPYIMSATPDSLPKPQGYLKVEQAKVEYYKNRYLNTNKIKIGISYCANPKYNNVTQRDIPLKTFYPLTKLENVEVYSLQVSDPQDQINQLPGGIKIINLAKTFNNFEDTACALLNLDLVITTDNVILNLAGALGVKTYALFNRLYDHRWFDLKGEDVGWYTSVKPFCAQNFNGWDELMEKVIPFIKTE